MELRALLEAAAEDPAGDRQSLYAALLASPLHVRVPAATPFTVTNPQTGQSAVPAFLTAMEAEAFWREAVPGSNIAVEAISLQRLAGAVLTKGGLVIDPTGASLLIGRAELITLAAGEVPGEFAAWMREPARLGRQPAEVSERLRRSQVHVLVGKGEVGEAPRLYLLEKSEDGTLAVPCFSSPETLAQFAQVRRLFDGGETGYAAGIVSGDHCLQVAAGLGAYVLIDPEAPWETQLEPPLLM